MSDKPKRYFLQISKTISGYKPDVREAEDGEYIDYSEYQKVEAINELLKSVVNRFFHSASLDNPPDTQSYYALAEKLKQLPESILDFTEEQVRDNPAWALAVFRHKVKEMQYKRVHDLNQIGGQQEEIHLLKEQVENSRDALNKMTNAPSDAYGVQLSVSFWTKSGSKLPSSFSTFWTNEKQ